MASNEQIFIIKKKVSGHAAHHGGAWKVAYADFVTAMMALFIVLWLMTASQDVKKAIAGYFRDPKGFGTQTGSSMGGNGESLSISKDHMDLLKAKLQEAVKQSPELSKLKEYVQMTVTGEGLRIELLETKKGMFFENGKPEPTAYGKDLLLVLSQELGKLKNSVLVEGHTDSTPYDGNAEYSNWELSADRANAARRIMQQSGLRANQVSQVRGFADEQLRIPAHPDDPSNRRITIIVQYGQGLQASAVQNPAAQKAPAAIGQKLDAATAQKPAPVKPSGSHPH